MSSYNVGMAASSGTSQSQGSGESVKKKDQLGKDEFFKLLITQLRHQDPLEPMKDQEFIAQMAQFSSLEQMQQLNKNFEVMMVLQDKTLTNQTLTQAFNLLGAEIKAYLSETGEMISGVVEQIRMINGWPVLMVSGNEIFLDEIVEINPKPVVEEGEHGQEDSQQSSYLV
jgi:flagellar basal-body rod modification protein FlgD